MKNTTLNFYNQNAQAYADRVANASMEKELNLLISSLPEGKQVKILEIGAGSGRDLKYMLSKNFNVIPLEPSEALADMIEKEQNVPVIRMKAQDINFKNDFDGVYAMASLLHIPKSEILSTLKKINESLNENGSFLMNLKIGDGESVDSEGRFFSYYQKEEIQNLLEEAGFSNIKFDVNSDLLQRGTLQWLTVVSEKPVLKNTPKP